MCLSGIFYLYIFEYLRFMGPRGDQLPVEPIAHAVISAMFDVGGQDGRLFGYGHFYWGKWTFKSCFFGIAQFSEEHRNLGGGGFKSEFFFHSIVWQPFWSCFMGMTSKRWDFNPHARRYPTCLSHEVPHEYENTWPWKMNRKKLFDDGHG